VRALVFKSPQLITTVETARILNEVLADWSQDQDVHPVQVVGSVVLGPNTGGVNPNYAATCVDSGARVVWMPTVTAHWVAWFKQIPVEEAKAEGTYVLEGDQLLPEVEEVLDLVKERDVAISFGHLSKEEHFALAEACQTRGITRAFVDHPLAPAANFSVQELQRLAGKGVTINFTFWELSHYCGVTAQEMVAAIRQIGPQWVTLSSDSGNEMYAGSLEAMRLHAVMVDLYGFSPEEQRMMLSANQLRILGLDES